MLTTTLSYQIDMVEETPSTSLGQYLLRGICAEAAGISVKCG